MQQKISSSRALIQARVSSCAWAVFTHSNTAFINTCLTCWSALPCQNTCRV